MARVFFGLVNPTLLRCYPASSSVVHPSTFSTPWLTRNRSVKLYSTDEVHPPTLSCWKCGKPIPLPQDVALFLCPCERQVILPQTTTNYFKVMGCPISFKVDLDKLRNSYRQLQRVLHPDRYSTKSEVEQEYSAQQSTVVNKAYAALLKPYTRGLYLLKLNGYTIDEKDNTTAGSDLDFLEEVMTMNEQIAHLEAHPGVSELKSLDAVNNGHIQKCIQKLEDYFDKGDILQAKETIAKMKYFVNIEEKIHYLLPEEV